DVRAPTHGELELLRPDDVRAYLARERPEVVFHLAARVGGIGHNQRVPSDLYVDNVLMGTTLLEECRKHGVRKVVCVGSVCAYPSETPVPFSEDALWSGYPEA